MSLFFRRRVMLCVSLVLSPIIASAEATEIVRPLAEESAPAITRDANVAAEPVAGSRQPYVSRVGHIRFDSNLFLPVSPSGTRQRAHAQSMPSELSVTFFPGLGFVIHVEDVSHISNDTVVVQGRVEGQPTASFTLTETSDSFLITLQDITNAWLYRVVGDTDSGVGEVTEIDQMQIPPVIDSPPISLPDN